jgi:ABC-type branched-subunit amino acid transport system substrate-binding protein
MRRRLVLFTVSALVAVACGGHGIRVAREIPAADVTDAATTEELVDVGTEGGGGSGGGGGGGGGGGDAGAVVTAGGGTGETGQTGGGRSRGACATTSNPAQGFTDSSIKVGTVLPLSGALRPLAEQVARVMKITTEEYLPTVDSVPGPLEHLNWDCPERPGIYGRRLEVKIYSLQSTTPEEALAGMRRLIDVEKVFLVRDCYLQDSLMGPATRYQNSKGVPAVWCHFGGMPVPELAPWTFNPGIDPLTQAAIHTGYLINELGRQRIAILADPFDENTIVEVVRRVAEHLGHPIPDDCVVLKRSQEAPNGMRSEVAAMRTCYGAQPPDAVFAGDALQAVFGAMEAKSQGWRGADAGVQWACTNPSCWVVSLAEICGDACEGMITDCATLPCVPWADQSKYPAIANLERVRSEWLPGEPKDAVTYGAMSIGSGIALWLTMAGPDLSRTKFKNVVENLRDWSAGIGPVIRTSPSDHYGAKAQWLVRYTGRAPWFDDVTGDFITLSDVGVPESLTRLG